MEHSGDTREINYFLKGLKLFAFTSRGMIRFIQVFYVFKCVMIDRCLNFYFKV